jgi:hypothetical protein
MLNYMALTTLDTTTTPRNSRTHTSRHPPRQEEEEMQQETEQQARHAEASPGAMRRWSTTPPQALISEFKDVHG